MRKLTLETLQAHPELIERIAVEARRERALAVRDFVVSAVRRLFHRAPARPAQRLASTRCT